MDVFISGVKAPTEEYKKKVAAYRALEDAGLDIPQELVDYFNGEEPDEDGIKVKIKHAIDGDPNWEGGAIIDLSKLPPGVTHIKVYLA